MRHLVIRAMWAVFTREKLVKTLNSQVKLIYHFSSITNVVMNEKYCMLSAVRHAYICSALLETLSSFSTNKAAQVCVHVHVWACDTTIRAHVMVNV